MKLHIVKTVKTKNDLKIEEMNKALQDVLKSRVEIAEIPLFQRYLVTRDGVIRNRKTGEVVKTRNKTKTSNRQRIDLINDEGKRVTLHIAQVVVSAFTKIPYNEISKFGDIDHKDNNRANDTVYNLQVLSREANMKKYQDNRQRIKGMLLGIELEKRSFMLKKVA